MKQLKRSRYPLRDSDIKKLVDSADHLRDRVIIKLLAYCGLRRAETARAEVKDLDWKNRRLMVLGKGNKERLVPIPDSVFQDLKFYLHKRRNGYIFPSRRRDSKFPYIGLEQINQIVKAAGWHANLINPNPNLKTINPHSLRHYYAHKLKNSGVRIETISYLLGHTDIKTTLAEYGNQSIEEMQQEIARVW